MSDQMTAVGTTALVATALMPVVSLIKRPSWNKQQSYLLGMVAAIIAATIGAVVDGHVDSWQKGIVLVLTGLGTSQSVYQLYFSNTSTNNKLSEM